MKHLTLLLLALLAGCGTGDGTCHVGGFEWNCSGTVTPADAAPAPDVAVDAPVVQPDSPVALPDARIDAFTPDVKMALDAAPVAHRMGVGTQLWQLGWMDSSYSFVPGVNFATTASPWQPALIADLAQYTGPLRSMDAVATNNTQASAWAQRTAKTAGIVAQTGDNGVAWEWWIDACNRAHRDCWFNIPYKTATGRAINDYAVALATLVKATLDPGLKAIFEYSNEAWNGSFATLNYTKAQGQALHLDADEWTNAFKYYAVASARIFDAVDSVMGAGNPRVVHLMAGQRDNAWLVGVHLAQLAAEGQHADAYAFAPYFRGTTVSDNRDDMVAMLDALQGPVDVVKAHGLPVWCYEGGQENYSGATGPNHDPGMYGLYRDFLTELDTMGVSQCSLYLHVAPCSDGNCWGVRESLSQALGQAHRWRAITDWTSGR